MAIQSGDVKLLKSSVMSDVPEGGGAPSGTVIADGVSNTIFPDVSELDRAGGRVNLRKVFAKVDTDDVDTYMGANVIVAEPPEDPRVSVTLFSTGSTFDERDQAKSRIESYLNAGSEWGGFLLENHLAGQRVIQLLQRPNSVLPSVGATFVLVGNEGLSTAYEQYVRITSVASDERTFTYIGSGGAPVDYAASVVTLGISDSLRYDFAGSPANRLFARTTTSAKVRDTVVADAGTYVGVVPLTAAATLGDLTISAESIYTQLVPSAQTETPITLSKPYSAAGLPAPGASAITYTFAGDWTPSTSLSLPGGCRPKSLTITVLGLTITDDGGVLKTDDAQLGTIDYANGVLTLASTTLNGAKSITYTPAAQILRAPQSSEIAVTALSQSMSYVGVIDPVPQPGTLSVSFMAQGRWYTLSDPGNGTLRGADIGFGAGTVNTDSGSFVVTLGALPDVGSSIILTWNVPTQETSQPGQTLKARQRISLTPPAGESVQPGSLSVTWVQDGAKTATVSSAGVVSGDATGVLRASANELEFAPNIFPAVGAELTITYSSGAKTEDSFAHPSRDGTGKVPVTASLGTIQPGSLEVEWNTLTDVSVLGLYTNAQLSEMGVALVDPTQYARDDGAGNIVLNGANIGTVVYATGVVTFMPDSVIKIPRPNYVRGHSAVSQLYRMNYSGMSYVSAATLYPNDTSGYVKLRYNSAAGANAQTQTVTFSPSLDLLPEVGAKVVPGSVVLVPSGGAPWGDSGTGLLREFTTDGWMARGTINYLTGSVALSTWVAGETNVVERSSCVTTVGENISSEFVFRTAAAPLRSSSLTLQYSRASGGVQTVTADSTGAISAPGVDGRVDYDTGVVRLRFGAKVVAAGNEAEPWFDAANVDGDGNIWKPAPVMSSTVQYTAVAYSYLPLDASIIGLDPVRLPNDGRVPIFRSGGFAVVGHTAALTATVSNAQTIDCARVRLSRVRVIGANGVVINTGYTTDLEAGTVTFTDVAGYSQPVTIEHRIEDMAVVREALINGQLSFTRPLTHDYPVGSYVSSALVAGDKFARTSIVFDQATWTNVWSDEAIGSPATATFNDVAYPIAVTNRGALTERWAVRFTNSTSFEVIGENVGVIATGNTSTDCAPLNPNTSAPYFELPALGWGGGWGTGNVLRFNTIGAEFPVWVVRTVQQGPETVPDDQFTILIRGDVDTP